jgi:hypothetical protein
MHFLLFPSVVPPMGGLWGTPLPHTPRIELLALRQILIKYELSATPLPRKSITHETQSQPPLGANGGVRKTGFISLLLHY